jgi:hypothetical protein
MRSNWVAYLALSSLALTGCGLLGDKNAPEKNSNVSATGCLNDSKDLIGRYLDGAMSQAEWKSSFDCINQSLDFFTDFVRGSAADSYTQGDMYTLMTKFLITNGKVRKDLLKGAFTLKSALFGGDAREFKKEEIDLLKTSLTRLRDITGDLIPYLQLRRDPNASLAQILEMVPAFKRAGDQLHDFINTLPTGMMSSEALELLFNELTYTLDLNAVDDLGEKVSIAKWMMFNTRRDAFETQDWANIFRNAFGLGGILLAYKTSVGNDPTAPRAQLLQRLGDDYRFREFLWELALAIRPYIRESIAQHNGATPLPLFDHIIDALPKGILDNVPKPVLKNALRPIILRLLQSQSQIGVDEGVVNTIFGTGETLVRNLGLLDRFYEKTGLDTNSVQPDTMKNALEQFEGTLSGREKSAFAGMRTALNAQVPMMDRDTGYMRFTPGLGYSKLQQQMVVAFDVLARFIHGGYGSGKDYFVESDMVTFFSKDQLTPLLYALKMVDETAPDFGKKRFRDMNLFTPIANGDDQATFPELTSYAMLIVSASKMTADMKKEIYAACPEDRGVDNMGSRWIAPNCFRRNYHERLDHWLGNFPRMKAYWSTLSADDRARALKWLEHGARRNGYTWDQPASGSTPALVAEDFGTFDTQAMATILHYTESLFNRFDINLSEQMSKSEVNTAFGLFRGILQMKVKEVANINLDSDYLLKGIYTYIVRYREMPEISLSNLGNVGQLGWWIAVYSLPTTNYSTDRLGVFNIVCQLAVPESKTQAGFTKTVCAP